MSASALEPDQQPSTVSRPRPHLVLVPTGRDAVGRGRHAQPRMRLTRRGRFVIAVLVALVLGALAVAVGGRLAAASERPRSIVVKAGQTLSEIAARELPQLPISEGVVELQVANGMSSSGVLAGQTLFIPSP
ncbi:peptidoglycan-binding protein [Intrasporangium oryzae NRRL B-24470]|uniref:Peptidoglycan-binding protein n=1 Tax=Intrasporangium oryzae NRRL B-24470 TaxID=1386089 RepID=W9GEA4_9MICO|nr:LysM peptidoglycan-binding domain-containing protein [Intrasporangium oryzae]EWT03158.1 peptidoglycan-binding protein [Intrasporangium oryzae NRRL B-24470]